MVSGRKKNMYTCFTIDLQDAVTDVWVCPASSNNNSKLEANIVRKIVWKEIFVVVISDFWPDLKKMGVGQKAKILFKRTVQGIQEGKGVMHNNC